MKNLNCLMNRIIYIRCSRLFLAYLKKHASIRICINKIENNITFKIKTGYYLELFSAVPRRNLLLLERYGRPD